MQHFKYLFVLLTLCLTTNLYAGLGVELAPNLSAERIKSLTILGDDLIVDFKDGQHTIQLPKYVLPAIIKWVASGVQGPQGFSIDGAIVPSAPDYMPPSIPKSLGNVMLSYDVYAHTMALGGLPEVESSHPLVELHGNTSKMPNEIYNNLMNSSNTTPKAKWYQQMTARYTSRPRAVGELTVRAIPSPKGLPVTLEVSSYITLRPNHWFKSIDVVARKDAWLFSLPYQPLKEDIETRWSEYRKAFEAMEELSSIVEAYAILHTYYHQNNKGWNTFISNNVTGVIHSINSSNEPYLDTPYWYSQWTKLAVNNLNKTIQSKEEVIFTLAILQDDKAADYIDSDLINQYDYQLEQWAATDTEIHLQYLLRKIARTQNSEEVEHLIGQYFKLAKEDVQWFNYRIEGLRFISDEVDISYDLYEREVIAILEDYLDLVVSHTGNSDLAVWERLSQLVYSTGLLNMLEDIYFSYPKSFIQQLALVHRNRGRVFQKGRELDYIHAHFRFLGYLADNVYYDIELKQQIKSYQQELATLMGLTQWDEDKFEEEIEDDDYASLYSDNDDETYSNIQDNYHQIQGRLYSIQSLFDKNANWKANIEKGIPLMLKTTQGKQITLLMDSRMLINEVRRTSKVRVSGIYYEAQQAISPLKIEIYKNRIWQTLNVQQAHSVFDINSPLKS